MGISHNTATIEHADGSRELLPGARFRAARAEGGRHYVVIDTEAPKQPGAERGAIVYATELATSMHAEHALRELKAVAHAKARELNEQVGDAHTIRLAELEEHRG